MAKMAAGVRKRTDGTFEKRFTIDGKRYSVYGKNAKEVEAKERETREKINSRLYIENRNITLDSYFETWIVEHEMVAKGSTIANYKSIYRANIKKALGARKLQRIERREIVEMLQGANEKHGTRYANLILTVLKTILKGAVNDEVIPRSPAANIPALKVTEAKAAETYHRALTQEEQKAFCNEIAGRYYENIIKTMLLTGMRCGEAGALQWDDIDYKNNVIHVTKTVTRDKNGKTIIGTTKTAAGTRDIPLTENLKAVLNAEKEKTAFIPALHSQVFKTPSGTLVIDPQVNYEIRSALDRLEGRGTPIEHFTAHAFRDTFATRCIEQGMNPKTLQTILGHSSLSMTMDLYAHVLPNTKQEEMKKVNIAI